MRRIRVGIDVGGTLTKAVAIDVVHDRIIGKVTVPTTHSSSEGVSTLKSLMEKYEVQNSEIELISHSTTQAVSALPESTMIQSEYISERSVRCVTAMGNVSLDIGTANAQEINEEAHVLACELFGINWGVQRIFDTNYHIFACELSKKKLFLKSKGQPVLVLDEYSRVRPAVDNATIFNGSPDQVAGDIEAVLQKHAADGKDLAPQVHILDGVKLMDFSGLTAPAHVSKAVRDELKKVDTKDVAAIVRLG